MQSQKVGARVDIAGYAIIDVLSKGVAIDWRFRFGDVAKVKQSRRAADAGAMTGQMFE